MRIRSGVRGPLARMGATLFTFVLAACSATGAGSTPVAATGTAASPVPSPSGAVDVRAEVDATIAGLEEALEKYRGGDTEGALDTIAETYEQHFELVEGPLGQVDHELMEELEALVAVQTRDAIQGGKPVADLEALVAQARTELNKAKDLLP